MAATEGLRRLLRGLSEAEFRDRFGSEEACRKALFEMRWRAGLTCPSCGHRIRWHENIPVLGWLRLRGRCSAWRWRASVASRLASSRPAFQIGCVSDATRPHTVDGPSSRLDRSLLALPRLALSGGAVFTDGTLVVDQGSILTGNVSDQNGGAIAGGPSITISASEVTHNASSSVGGGESWVRRAGRPRQVTSRKPWPTSLEHSRA